MISFWYLLISTILFLIGFVIAIKDLKIGYEKSKWVTFWISVVGFIFQTFFLIEKSKLYGQFPISIFPDVLVFIGWNILISYILLGHIISLSLLGVFSILLVTILQLIAIFNFDLKGHNYALVGISSSRLEQVHAYVSLMAYGSFGLASVSGFMYIVQDYFLKHHFFNKLFHFLPPIIYLVKASSKLFIIGFFLISIGIGISFFIKTDQFVSKEHFIILGSIWFIYGMSYLMYVFKKVSPKVLAYISIIAFIWALVAYVIYRMM